MALSMADHPPSPWHLVGDGYLSGWFLPADELPAVPQGIRPVVTGGRGLVVTAWVDYRPGGVLAYHELMATVAVHNGHGVGASITHIWVDSPESRAGGRALWHIPKELAEFRFDDDLTAKSIARAVYRPVAGLPVRVPAAFSVLQDGPLVSPVRVRSKPVAAWSAWRVEPAGPLGFLHGRSPAFSVIARDFRMRFGR
jgi:hypothetical protein